MMEEEDLTRARNRLSAGRIRAMEKAPYLSTALLSLEPRETPGLNTFAVDKRWVLYYDPQKCLDWSVDEIAAVWLHEISHVIRDHAERFTATGDPVSNAEYFNIAADAAINSDLKDMGVLLPDADKRWYAEANPLYPKWRRNMTAEEMYVIAKKGKGKKQEEEKGKGESEESEENEEKDSSESNPAEDGTNDSMDAEEESKENEEKDSSDSENNDSDDADSQDNADSQKDPSNDSAKEDNPSEEESRESSSGDNQKNSDSDSTDEDDSDVEGDEQGGDESDSEDESDKSEESGDSEGDGDSEKDSEAPGEQSGEDDSEGSEGSSEASEGDSNESESNESSDAHDHEGNCGSGAHGVPQEYEVDDGTGFDPMEAEHMRRQVAQEISDYNERYGTVPGGMVRDAKKLLDPQVDWTEELLSYVRKEIATVVGQNDYTYSRPSRRGSQTPFILPSMRQQPPPEIVVILDTSGSMKIQEEIAQALGEMEVLIETAARYSPIQGIRIINCDAGANIPVIVSDLNEFEIIGGGGTDMRIGIQAAAELEPPAGIIITMTDGYTPWPREVPEENQDALYIALIIESKKKSRGGSQQRGWSTTGIPEWMHVIEVNTK